MLPAPAIAINIRGFTLFELLAALVIVGIVVSIAVLAIGDNQAEREQRVARQFATLAQLARETALFNAEQLGLSFWQKGYTFYRLEQNQFQPTSAADAQQPTSDAPESGAKETPTTWQPLNDDPQLRPRELPDDISLSLYLEGLKVKLSPLPKEDDKPQVFILSSGEVSAFEVRIGDGTGSEVSIEADAIGNFSVAVLEGSAR